VFFHKRTSEARRECEQNETKKKTIQFGVAGLLGGKNKQTNKKPDVRGSDELTLGHETKKNMKANRTPPLVPPKRSCSKKSSSGISTLLGRVFFPVPGSSFHAVRIKQGREGDEEGLRDIEKKDRVIGRIERVRAHATSTEIVGKRHHRKKK
jgi:hypothetical protein